jgi:hypothetical protein
MRPHFLVGPLGASSKSTNCPEETDSNQKHEWPVRIECLSTGCLFSLAYAVRTPGKAVFGFFVPNIEKSKRACG